MLGGLLDKIGASLGKSYLFAGLLPAGVLMAVLACYRFGFTQFWSQIPGFGGDEIKSITAFGAAWLVLGFVLFAIRTLIFRLFEIVPTGWLGSLLVNRQLRKRGRVEQKGASLLWLITVARWYEFEFAPEAAGSIPPWMPPSPEFSETLCKAKQARDCIDLMTTRDASAVPSWREHNCILAGLEAVFISVANRSIYNANKTGLDEELNAWRTLLKNPVAKSTLQNLAYQVHREWVTIFEKTLSYGQGPWVYPTSLGNRLAALDDYAQKRYGITTAVIWDRLWWILPDTAKEEVSDAKLGIEVLLNLGAVLLFAAAVVGVTEIGRLVPALTTSLTAGSDARGVILIAICILFAIASYRGAVFALGALVTKMTSLVDMYRLQFLSAAGLRPKIIAEEIELLAELDKFFVQGTKRKPCRTLTIPAKSEDKSASQSDDGATRAPTK